MSVKVSTKLEFRNDIEGLRGIAILFVVLFHVFPEIFPGGFVGVDIFFVISGYLINSIIVNELKLKSFSLIHFYKKRIRRIYPALVTVLISFIILGYFLLTVDEYQQLAQQVFASSFFVSNYIYSQDVKYFDSIAVLKPMLHTWSLSIEEQFYILWPVLSILFWSKLKTKFKYIWTFSVISFVFFVIFVKKDYSFSFYNSLTRFWEIGLGCYLGYVHTMKNESISEREKKYSQTVSNFIAALSLLYLIYFLFYFNYGTYFYEVMFLLVPVATLMIVFLKDSLINKYIFSNPQLRYLGKISYPLYLWHWPLLSFGFILQSTSVSFYFFEFKLKIIVLLISVILAICTYQFIELKIIKNSNLNRVSLSLFFVMLAVSCFSFLIYNSNGIPQRYDNHNNDKEVRHNPSLNVGLTSCGYDDAKIFEQYCWQTVSEPHNLVLFGDSHAQLLFRAIVNHKNDSYNKAIILGAGNCHPIDFENQSESCRLQYEKNLILLNKNLNFKYILLSHYPKKIIEGNPEDIELYFQAYLKTIQSYKKYGKKIIFLIEGPWLDFNIDSCMVPDLFWREKLSRAASACADPKPNDFKNQDVYLNFVNRLKKSNLDILFFDVKSVLCNDETCRISDNGNLLYYDDNHLSQYATQKVVDRLVEFLKTIN